MQRKTIIGTIQKVITEQKCFKKVKDKLYNLIVKINYKILN